MASEFKHTEAFINKYVTEVEKEILNRIVQSGKVSSGRLFNSLRKEVKHKDGVFNIRFYFIGKAKEYAPLVDKGVSGAGIPEGFKGKKKQVNKGQYDKDAGRVHSFRDKMPPIKSIREWVKIQGLPKGTEFPIRRSIFIFGIAPTNFFTIPTTRRQKQFEAGIEKNMAKDFEEILTKGLKK